MKVLAIESSTETGSMAWRVEGELLFRVEFAAGRGQAGLFTAVEEIRHRVSSCDRLVVGIGPGSYSGMRVAAAAAIGLRHALGGELVGIPSVLGFGPGRYTVIGDARRGEGYYIRVDDSTILEGPTLVTMERLTEIARTEPVVASAPVAGLAPEDLKNPDAAWLAFLGERGVGILQRGTLEPLYIREPTITVAKRIPTLRKG